MRDNEQNERLVAYITKRLPQNIKKVTFFTDLLDLSNESAYRRLRGEIPFTLEELVKLSKELDFSIDEALAKDNTDKAVFDLKTDMLSDPQEAFLNILTSYCDDVILEVEGQNRNALVSLNHMILPFSFRYSNMFRFNYYKWIHQSQDVSLNYSFSDVVLPLEINLLRKRAAELSDMVDNTTMILDNNIYLHTIKDMQYYYRRNLITKEEFKQIKEEFIFMIEQTERLVQTGLNRFGKSRYYYISPLSIKSNIVLVHYDATVISHLWYNSLTPISTTNSKLCSDHVAWLNSLKKYSSLITQSNEILSSEFFNQQRKYAEEMDVIMY